MVCQKERHCDAILLVSSVCRVPMYAWRFGSFFRGGDNARIRHLQKMCCRSALATVLGCRGLPGRTRCVSMNTSRLLDKVGAGRLSESVRARQRGCLSPIPGCPVVLAWRVHLRPISAIHCFDFTSSLCWDLYIVVSSMWWSVCACGYGQSTLCVRYTCAAQSRLVWHKQSRAPASPTACRFRR